MKGLHFIGIFAMVLSIAGCSIKPPLYLRGTATLEVQLIARIDVQVMWQADWQTRWQFDWNTAALGPVGYTDPQGVRMHIYTQGADGQPRSHIAYNFHGNQARMDIFEGTHNLLFHNNDSEALLFGSEDELHELYCYTRNISTGLKASNPVYTVHQKAIGFTKAPEEAQEPVSLPPDQLFSLYDKNRVISANPEDYVFEDGRYILRIESTLLPSDFIYLVQVKLLNNNGRVIGCAGGGAITGMAGGVELMTRKSFESTVSVPMDVYYQKSKDMLGARVITFGIPGCNPYDEESLAAAPEKEHNLVLSLNYVNGTYRNIRIDITDQILASPLGGIIELELDVDDFPSGGGEGAGGFSALIDGWQEEKGHITIK